MLARVVTLAVRRLSPAAYAAARKWGPQIANSPQFQATLTRAADAVAKAPERLKRDRLAIGLTAAREMAREASALVDTPARIETTRSWMRQLDAMELSLRQANSSPRAIRRTLRDRISDELSALTIQEYELVAEWARAPTKKAELRIAPKER
jgi:hypothetical protein